MSALDALLARELGAHAAAVSTHFQLLKLPAGAALIREGVARAGWLYLVLDGEVEVMAEVPDGGFAVVKRVGGGQLLGLLGLIDGQPRSATCRATTDATLASMTSASFRQLYDARNDAGLAFVDWCARQLVSDIRRLDAILREAAGPDVG